MGACGLLDEAPKVGFEAMTVREYVEKRKTLIGRVQLMWGVVMVSSSSAWTKLTVGNSCNVLFDLAGGDDRNCSDDAGYVEMSPLPWSAVAAGVQKDDPDSRHLPPLRFEPRQTQGESR